jgi:TRAP-type C4-dicarboxylate transport system permease small subunit
MKTLAAIATGFAYAAGLLLLAAMAITCASVAGRNTGAWSLDGDFELVSLLSGAALALCLPLGQLRRGNIIVDALTAAAPPAVRAGLDRLGAAGLAQ